jgi:hypothetical protein
MFVRDVLRFVESDFVGEGEGYGWIMEGVPLKKLDLP